MAERMCGRAPARGVGPSVGAACWEVGSASTAEDIRSCCVVPRPAVGRPTGRIAARRRPSAGSLSPSDGSGSLRGREPAAPAIASGSAVVGRRGGRSVHGVPRRRSSVGLRTSAVGRCLLSPVDDLLSCPVQSHRPMRPHSTRIATLYGQVRRECDIGRTTLTAASHSASAPGRITENTGLRSLRPVTLHWPAFVPHETCVHHDGREPESTIPAAAPQTSTRFLPP